MLAIDANLTVLYLTGDHPNNRHARALIDGRPAFAAVTMMLEVEWALRSTYGYQPTKVARAIRTFAGFPTVTAQDGAVLVAVRDFVEKGFLRRALIYSTPFRTLVDVRRAGAMRRTSADPNRPAGAD